MKRKICKLLILGGIIGPILFTLITIASAFLRPEYTHINNFISELGATDTANENLMNLVGFFPSGLLITLFGLTLLLTVSKNMTSKIGSLMIMIFGLGMTMAGIFSCDQGCPPDGSLESIIHDRISAVTFISAILGTILLGFSFRKMSLYRNLALYSILSGFISAVFLLVMISSFETRILTGLWQRLLLFSIFLWTAIISIRTFKVFDQLTSNK